MPLSILYGAFASEPPPLLRGWMSSSGPRQQLPKLCDVAFTPADLQMVDDHIAQGERHVSRQLELIAWLKSRGHPTAQAEELLHEFQSTLIQHRAHRDLMVHSNEIFP